MIRAIVILLAVALDLALGDPPNRFHPLLLMGRWLSWGRWLAPANRRFWFGAGWTLAGMLLFALPFWILEMRNKELAYTRRSSFSIHWSSFLIHPFLLKPVFAYRNLRRAVIEVGKALEAHNLAEARRLVSWHLVSRDSNHLSEAEVAGAAIESLAENLTDSLTAPLLSYALGGLSPAWAYRFINTADAMWGYRTAEFEQLGKFTARLDDVLNWLPARFTGWLLVIATWLAREDARGAARTMLAQRNQTASPNAGWTMSAMAGALGVTLSKDGIYELVGGQAEPGVSAIQRALRVADINVGLNVLVIGLSLVLVRFCRIKQRIKAE